MRTTKLKKAKVKKTDRLEKRKTDWINAVAVLKQKRPRQGSVYTTYKFLRSVLVDPMGDGDKEKLVEVKYAKMYLEQMNEKHPESRYEPLEKKVDKRRRLRNKTKRKSVRSELNKVKEQLFALEYKRRKLETKFHTMCVRNPKWKETYDLVCFLRTKIRGLTEQFKTLKSKL